MYAVRMILVSDAVNSAGNILLSLAKDPRIKGVASEVLVRATFRLAAKQRQANEESSIGKTNTNALPKAAPALNRGKMKPPRNPAATVKVMDINFKIPTIVALMRESIWNPMSPDAGKI